MSIKPPFTSSSLVQNETYLPVVNALMAQGQALSLARFNIESCNLVDTRIVLRFDSDKPPGQRYELFMQDLAQNRKPTTIAEKQKLAATQLTVEEMRAQIAASSLRRPVARSLGFVIPMGLVAAIQKGPPYLPDLLAAAGHAVLGADVAIASVSPERLDVVRLASDAELVVAIPSPADWQQGSQFKVSLANDDSLEGDWIPSEVIVEALLAGAQPVAYALLASSRLLERASSLSPNAAALHERARLSECLPQGSGKRNPRPL